MKLTLNGESKVIALDSPTLASLLGYLKLDPHHVMVEKGNEVHKGTSELTICDGDQLEILHFVGGGSE